MKKILIPVDFSEYSQCAVDYACQLPLVQNGVQELELVHVFTNQSNLYVNREFRTTLQDPQVEVAKVEMEKLKEVIHLRYPSVNYHELFRSGNLYEEISKVTAEFAYDAVMMGTKGTSGLEALFLGSNTYDVILNTRTPVVGVPKGSTTFKKERIGLLCNFKPSEIEALQQAINLFGKGFELILIHVNKDDRDIRLIDEQFKNWINEIIQMTGVENISYTVKSQALYNRAVENISHAISNALIDEQIDIMLVTKSRKSFFRQIMGENIVRKLAYNMPIPTLFARVHAKA